MSRWPCIPNPWPGCTRSSLMTRKYPEAHVLRVVVVVEGKRVAGVQANRDPRRPARLPVVSSTYRSPPVSGERVVPFSSLGVVLRHHRFRRPRVCVRPLPDPVSPMKSSDKVGDDGGRIAFVVGQQWLLDHPIRFRHPLVLPQMLDPRSDEEDFHDAARLGGVLKHVPEECPVPQPGRPAAGRRPPRNSPASADRFGIPPSPDRPRSSSMPGTGPLRQCRVGFESAPSPAGSR